MKKFLALCLTAIMSVGLFAGCGGEGEVTTDMDDSTTSDAVLLADINVEDYITLGDYKNLTIAATETTIDEAQVDYYSIMFYQGMLTEANAIADKAIEDGDYVYISYVGLLDDVAFEGGTGTSYLGIGTGQFIPGFEEGLIGVMPGESVSLELTFPEDYDSEELKGQNVVFEVEVLYNTGAMDDAGVTTVTGGEYTTLADFKAYVNEYLSASLGSTYEQELESEILTQVVTISTFSELPEAILEKYKQNMTTNLTSVASTYGMDLATYCTTYYGMEESECIQLFSENAVKQGFAFQAIANAEGIVITDEILNSYIEEMIAGSDYESVDDFIGEDNREEYREYVMFEEVLAFIKENCIN